MRRLIALLIGLASSAGRADESPVVDTRLALAIEAAVKATGLSINISQSSRYSVNINRIEGRGVCEPQSAENARKLQDALSEQPDVKENYGPAYFSLNTGNGERKVVSVEEMIRRGVVKGCTDIYVSVASK